MHYRNNVQKYIVNNCFCVFGLCSYVKTNKIYLRVYIYIIYTYSIVVYIVYMYVFIAESSI